MPNKNEAINLEKTPAEKREGLISKIGQSEVITKFMDRLDIDIDESGNVTGVYIKGTKEALPLYENTPSN